MCNEKHQLLEDLHKPVAQNFPMTNGVILQTPAWVEDPFRVQDGLMDLNIRDSFDRP